MSADFLLSCVAGLAFVGLCAVFGARRPAATPLRLCRVGRPARSRPARPRWRSCWPGRCRPGSARCRSACPGSACISGSTAVRLLPRGDRSGRRARPASMRIGYGRHETAPQRVLPFYPAFLAAMNLVVLADDAFSFLVAWEFMSLTSWALVMSHHRAAENANAGYVYLVMASFGTLALLLGFGLLGRTGRRLCLRGDPRGTTGRRHRGAGARAGAGRRRFEGGAGAAPRLAAARPSGRAEPRLRADERGDDQGRDLRLHPHRVRSGRAAGAGGGACWSLRCRRPSRRCSACSTR